MIIPGLNSSFTQGVAAEGFRADYIQWRLRNTFEVLKGEIRNHVKARKMVLDYYERQLFVQKIYDAYLRSIDLMARNTSLGFSIPAFPAELSDPDFGAAVPTEPTVPERSIPHIRWPFTTYEMKVFPEESFIDTNIPFPPLLLKEAPSVVDTGVDTGVFSNDGVFSNHGLFSNDGVFDNDTPFGDSGPCGSVAGPSYNRGD